MQLINHVRKFTRLSSLLSTALLLASALASSQVYAADIDCSTDLIMGTLGTYANSLYGSCVSGVASYPGFLPLSGSVYTNVGSVSPPAPTPARNLGTLPSGGKIVNMGTTAPTLTSCIAATYTVDNLPAVTNNWYCARFVGTTDTGYMSAKWDGSALVKGSLSPVLTNVSAPIFSLKDKPAIFSEEVK